MYFAMKTITSKQAIKELPTILQSLKIEPIGITQHSRKYAVLISSDEYETLKSNEVTEDRILWAMATFALDDGILSVAESKTFMEDFSNFWTEWK